MIAILGMLGQALVLVWFAAAMLALTVAPVLDVMSGRRR